MSKPETIQIATTCLEAWSSGDFATARSVLREDVTFVGPRGTAGGIDASMVELAAVADQVTSVEHQKVVADGNDVCIMYDLVTRGARTVPTSDWYHVRNGKIDAVRACVDARALADPAMAPRASRPAAVPALVPSCVSAEMEIAAWDL